MWSEAGISSISISCSERKTLLRRREPVYSWESISESDHCEVILRLWTTFPLHDWIDVVQSIHVSPYQCQSLSITWGGSTFHDAVTSRKTGESVAHRLEYGNIPLENWRIGRLYQRPRMAIAIRITDRNTLFPTGQMVNPTEAFHNTHHESGSNLLNIHKMASIRLCESCKQCTGTYYAPPLDIRFSRIQWLLSGA